jgi:HSP20 family protein
MANIMKRNNGNSSVATPSSVMPFGGLVDRVIRDSFNRFFDDDFWKLDGAGNNVPVNIRETDKDFELEVVAPGLKKEDFTVSMDKNMLTIAFNHKEEDKKEDKDGGYLRQEYRMQSFSRSFNLDETVDSEKISAQYINGLLRVTLPKKEGSQKITRNIEIK